MRRAAPLMGRRPPTRHPRPRAHAAPVVLLGRPRHPGQLRARQAARRRPGRRDARRAAAAARAQRPTRWASTTRCARRWHEAAQPPGRAPDRQRGDRRPRGAHGDGRERRGALDPGGQRRHARGRAARAVEAGQPRAARAHLLEVPQPRDARDHPRHLHRAGARGGRDRPPAGPAALPRARVRHVRRPRDRAVADPGRPARLHSATRATSRSTSSAWSPSGRATRGSTSRSRSRTSIPRSRPGSRAGSTCNTQSRIHVLVTHGFLRSLAKLELEESAVGRFAERRARPRPVNVGDTPWQGVAVLACSQQRSRHPCDFDERGVEEGLAPMELMKPWKSPRKRCASTATPAALQRLARRPRPRRAAGRSRR